ncbi:MAG: radical SAM protein [Halanaerobiales bacterium]|nr:radical SAM protein [Halanaerobiales bacterium]
MKIDFREKMGVLVTLSCDCKCKHCYIDSQPVGSTTELALNVWKEILDNYKKRGGKELSLHGGEPLLYKDIDALLLYAHKIGLQTSLITNTLYLDDLLIKVLHDFSYTCSVTKCLFLL